MSIQRGASKSDPIIQLWLCIVVVVFVPILTDLITYLPYHWWLLLLAFPLAALVCFWFRNLRIPALVGLAAWIVALVVIFDVFGATFGD